MLAISPYLVKMEEAVDQEDYKTFFEYRMDQYTKSGIVGRETTKSTKDFGQQILNLVIDHLALMIKDALKEEIPQKKGNNNKKY
jgi:creatinine amidohydrolase/Fe(II)-dependent formamide hydrolase-like protein